MALIYLTKRTVDETWYGEASLHTEFHLALSIKILVPRACLCSKFKLQILPSIYQGVFEVDPENGLTLTEKADDVELEEIILKTGCEFEVRSFLQITIIFLARAAFWKCANLWYRVALCMLMLSHGGMWQYSVVVTELGPMGMDIIFQILSLYMN